MIVKQEGERSMAAAMSNTKLADHLEDGIHSQSLLAIRVRQEAAERLRLLAKIGPP